jgi:hypothetical protein
MSIKSMTFPITHITAFYSHISGSQFVKFCYTTQHLYVWNGIDRVQIFNSVGQKIEAVTMADLTEIFEEHCFTELHRSIAINCINEFIQEIAKEHKQWIADMEEQQEQELDEEVLDHLFLIDNTL